MVNRVDSYLKVISPAWSSGFKGMMNTGPKVSKVRHRDKVYLPAIKKFNEYEDWELIVNSKGLFEEKYFLDSITFEKLNYYFDLEFEDIDKSLFSTSKVLFIPYKPSLSSYKPVTRESIERELIEKGIVNTLLNDHYDDEIWRKTWNHPIYKTTDNYTEFPDCVMVFNNEPFLFLHYFSYYPSIFYIWYNRDNENNIEYYAKEFKGIDSLERLNDIFEFIENGDTIPDFIMNEQYQPWCSVGSWLDLLLEILNNNFDENIPRDKFFKVLMHYLGNSLFKLENNVKTFCNQIINYAYTDDHFAILLRVFNSYWDEQIPDNELLDYFKYHFKTQLLSSKLKVLCDQIIDYSHKE